MEIIKNFGLDTIILGAQIVNFLIIFFILKRFAYKPILDILKKREDFIKEGLKQAEDGKKILDDALEKEKKILQEAYKKAEIIVKDARNRSIEIEKESAENTKKQAESMMIAAREQIEQEAKETEKKIAIEVSNLAVEFLQKFNCKVTYFDSYFLFCLFCFLFYLFAGGYHHTFRLFFCIFR